MYNQEEIVPQRQGQESTTEKPSVLFRLRNGCGLFFCLRFLYFPTIFCKLLALYLQSRNEKTKCCLKGKDTLEDQKKWGSGTLQKVLRRWTASELTLAGARTSWRVTVRPHGVPSFLHTWATVTRNTDHQSACD